MAMFTKEFVKGIFRLAKAIIELILLIRSLMDNNSSKDSQVVLLLVFLFLFSFGILNLIRGPVTQAQVGSGPYGCSGCTTPTGCCPEECLKSICYDFNNDGCPDRCLCASERACAITPISCRRQSTVPILCCPRFPGNPNPCARYDSKTGKCLFNGVQYDPKPCFEIDPNIKPFCFGQPAKSCGQR